VLRYTASWSISRVSSAALFLSARMCNHERVRRNLLLTSRRHIDLVRVAGGTC
jgi:hypothetical protein